MNSTQDHDADFRAFLIRLYHILVPLLVGRTEDPKMSGPDSSFEATSVAPNDLAPLILSPISMVFGPFKAFSNYF
jgi:hypothetical protein